MDRQMLDQKRKAVGENANEYRIFALIVQF
jgi:hypothetical protein